MRISPYDISDDAYERRWEQREQDEPDPPPDAEEMQVTWTAEEISQMARAIGEE